MGSFLLIILREFLENKVEVLTISKLIKSTYNYMFVFLDPYKLRLFNLIN